MPKAESRTYGDNDGTKQTGVDEEPVSAMIAHGGETRSFSGSATGIAFCLVVDKKLQKALES